QQAAPAPATRPRRGVCVSLPAALPGLGRVVPRPETAAHHVGCGPRASERGQVMSSVFTGMRAWFGRHKRVLKRVATAAFICLVIGLLIRVGVTIEWEEVVTAVLDTPTSALIQAVLLVVASYLVYTCFDLLGKWYVGHDIPWWKTMTFA